MNNRRSIFRATGIVSGLTLLSRFLGVARDIFMAGLFGTSTAMSAFVIAFTIPNLFRRLFGEGALSASFIPVFMERRKRDGDEPAWKVAQRVIFFTALFLTMICALMFIVMMLIPPTFFGEQGRLTLSLMKIMLPYIIFICLAGLSQAILNSFKYFALPAATPCILNVVWIIAAIFLAPHAENAEGKIHLIAWGILVAGVLQLGVQWPLLRKKGLKIGLFRPFFDQSTQRVLVLFGPAALGLAVTQVNVLIDRNLAAAIGPWAPAALYYSERIMYLPLGLFATALSTVLLPTFSSNAADHEFVEIRDTIRHSLRMLLFVMIPAAIGLLVLAQPIISLLYQWKAFDQHSTDLAALALQCYAPGLIVFSLAKVFAPAFYALKDTKTPFKLGVLCLVLNVLLNLTFIWLLPEYKKHAGIALATVCSSSIYATLMALKLQNKLGTFEWKLISSSFFRHLASGVIMGAVCYVVYHFGARFIPHEPVFFAKCTQIVVLCITILLGTIVYALTTMLFRCPEVRDIMQLVTKRR